MVTAICAVVHEGDVWIAGDCAKNSYLDMHLGRFSHSKITFRDGVLIGFSGRNHDAYHIWDNLVVPSRSGCDLIEWAQGPFRDAVFKAVGEHDPFWLICGVDGQLFLLGSDKDGVAFADGYWAIGCACWVCLGALHVATQASIPPQDAVLLSLHAAAKHDDRIRGPFDVWRLSNGTAEMVAEAQEPQRV